jgi:hypothetical protein
LYGKPETQVFIMEVLPLTPLLDMYGVAPRVSVKAKRIFEVHALFLELSGTKPKTQVLVLEVLPLTPLSDICGLALRVPGGEESFKAHTLFSEILRCQNLANSRVDPGLLQCAALFPSIGCLLSAPAKFLT